MEDIYVCKDCGSDQIREAVFVWYNTREEIRSVFDNVWCEECDCEVATVNKDEWFDSHFKVIRVSDYKDKNKEENNE